MEIKGIVDRVLLEIMDQLPKKPIPLREEVHLVNDLGFLSLELAQMVALLEMETGCDPFAGGASIYEIHTVGDLYRLYAETPLSAGG